MVLDMTPSMSVSAIWVGHVGRGSDFDGSDGRCRWRTIRKTSSHHEESIYYLLEVMYGLNLRYTLHVCKRSCREWTPDNPLTP